MSQIGSMEKNKWSRQGLFESSNMTLTYKICSRSLDILYEKKNYQEEKKLLFKDFIHTSAAVP